MPPKYGTLEERFWAQTTRDPNSGCWPCLAAGPRGYSLIRLPTPSKKKIYAHRLSWEIHNGPIPTSMQVFHKCDVPCCVNPKHLFLGTHVDNMADKKRKGRAPRLRGEQGRGAKLTEHEVREIRASKLNYAKLSRIYGVCPEQISNVSRRRHWTHI